METTIRLKADFPCVFLLNGTFAESAESFLYDTREPIYITALPLSAHLLPYTVKLAANKPLSNEKLCAAFNAGGQLHIKLFPRYNYIYTTEKAEEAAVSQPERLFRLVKQKNYAAARKLLSDSLSSSVDDTALDAFFAEYAQILKDDFSSPRKPNVYYLIDAEGNGTLYRFDAENGLVDNIVEHV